MGRGRLEGGGGEGLEGRGDEGEESERETTLPGRCDMHRLASRAGRAAATRPGGGRMGARSFSDLDASHANHSATGQPLPPPLGTALHDAPAPHRPQPARRIRRARRLAHARRSRPAHRLAVARPPAPRPAWTGCGLTAAGAGAAQLSRPQSGSRRSEKMGKRHRLAAQAVTWPFRISCRVSSAGTVQTLCLAATDCPLLKYDEICSFPFS